MRRAATQGHLNATELADFLVARNMPFRKAHELVGKIVLYALERNCALEDLRLSEFRKFSRPLHARTVPVPPGRSRAWRGGANQAEPLRPRSGALCRNSAGKSGTAREFQPRRYFLVFFDSSCLRLLFVAPDDGRGETASLRDRCNCPAWIEMNPSETRARPALTRACTWAELSAWRNPSSRLCVS